MKYIYVVIEKGLPDILEKFRFSLYSLYARVPEAGGNVIVRCWRPSEELRILCKCYSIEIHPVFPSRCFPGDTILNILVEKIMAMRDIAEGCECVVIDLDTEIVGNFHEILGKPPVVTAWPILCAREYPLYSERNLGNVLPQIQFESLGIDFDPAFYMYNTGFIFIPSIVRRVLCAKALLLVDAIHRFAAEDRYGDKLDEQIALSIVLQSQFRHNILTVEGRFLKHFWREAMAGKKWWS